MRVNSRFLGRGRLGLYREVPFWRFPNATGTAAILFFPKLVSFQVKLTDSLRQLPTGHTTY